MPTRRDFSKLFAYLLLALAVFMAWHLPRTAGEPPQDDAYISYIYARNFARDAGLVFNAGEPAVEGYTNYLWTIMIGWGYKFDITPERIAPLAGHLLTLLTVLAIFRFARRMGSTEWFAALAALLFATRPTLTTHAVGGMETPLFGLLFLIALMLRQSDEGKLRQQWLGSSVLALAALTRPEGVLLFGLLEICAMWEALRAKTPLLTSLRAALIRAIPFIVIVGAHVAWRRVTYGDWVPNTFHAKVEPSFQTWGDGWDYVSEGLFYFCPLLVLIPYFVSFGDQHASDRRRGLVVATVFTVYIVYVGGDYIPSFRFLWPIMPLWAALAAVAFTRLAENRLTRVLAGTFLLVVMVWSHTTQELEYSHQWVGLDIRHKRLVQGGKLLNELLPEDSWIAVTAAGRLPYYADRKTLDMMGLSDAHIGKRATMKKIGGLAGHLKGDGKYVLDCKPDVIAFLNLTVGPNSLAQSPYWRKQARNHSFGISEAELVVDPRFFQEYGLYSFPLAQRDSWLNVFARDGVFPDELPPGAQVRPPLNRR